MLFSYLNYHIKPYWNDNLSTLRDVMRTYRVDWIINCKCHDMKCELFYKYKKSKSEVREALRAAFDEYESSIVKQIENDIDVDQKSVWTILNKRKQKSSIMQSLGKKGTLVTDRNEILNVWQEHFETIFSKSVYLEMIYLTGLYIQQM